MIRIFPPSGVKVTENLRTRSHAEADQDSVHDCPGRRGFVTDASTRYARSSQFERAAKLFASRSTMRVVSC